MGWIWVGEKRGVSDDTGHGNGGDRAAISWDGGPEGGTGLGWEGQELSGDMRCLRCPSRIQRRL